MSISIADLIVCNGLKVFAIDQENQYYIGILYYKPQNVEYTVEIWEDSCCYATIMTPDDLVFLTCKDLPCIKLPCCPNRCLPIAMRMTIISNTSKCECLNSTNVLDWNAIEEKYELVEQPLCSCKLFAELRCSENKWVCYIELQNDNLPCLNGITGNFPLDCNTMTGVGVIPIGQANDFDYDCFCGGCDAGDITVILEAVPAII